MTYGKTIRALRNFTQASLNKEPEWRHPTTGPKEVQSSRFNVRFKQKNSVES
jgi:hypothetical protein